MANSTPFLLKPISVICSTRGVSGGVGVLTFFLKFCSLLLGDARDQHSLAGVAASLSQFTLDITSEAKYWLMFNEAA